MILLSDRGRKIPDIADMLGGLHTAKRPVRPAIVRIDNRKEVDQIERIVEEHPQKLDVVRERNPDRPGTSAFSL